MLIRFKTDKTAYEIDCEALTWNCACKHETDSDRLLYVPAVVVGESCILRCPRRIVVTGAVKSISVSGAPKVESRCFIGVIRDGELAELSMK